MSTSSPNSPDSERGGELVPLTKEETQNAIEVEVIAEDQVVVAPPPPPRRQEKLSGPKKPTFLQRLIQTTPFPYLFLIPILFLLYPAFSVTLERSAEAIRFDYTLDREEGFILNQALQMSRGESIYQPIEESPYLVGNYTPLYPAVLSELFRIQQPSLPLGRFVIFMASALIFAILLAVLYEETGSIYPGLLAAFLFLGYYGFRDWVAYARVDIPAIALGLAGLTAAANKHRFTGIFVACLCFTLAFLTKQTQVVAPAAAFFGLLWLNEKKLALILAVLTSIICGGLLLLWNQQTGGQVWLHLVEYNKNTFDFDAFLRFLVNAEFQFAPMIYITVPVLLIVGMVYKRVRGKAPKEIDPATHRPRSRALPMFTFFVLFSLLSTVSSAKVGSAVNYFLEYHLAVSLLISLLVGLIVKELPYQQDVEKRYKKNMLVGSLGVLYLCLFIHGVSLFVPREKFGGGSPIMMNLVTIPTSDKTYSYVHLQIAESKGPVLSDDPTFLIYTNQEIIYQPFIMGELSKEGRWNQQPFVDRILKQDFELIILTAAIRPEENAQSGRNFAPMTGWTDEMLSAIAENYKFHEQVGRYYLYIRSQDKKGKSALELVSSRRF